jgi:hypothetical protein
VPAIVVKRNASSVAWSTGSHHARHGHHDDLDDSACRHQPHQHHQLADDVNDE